MIEELIGKTLTKVENKGDKILFVADSGERWLMHHLQDCCENVRVDDICGDLDNLIGVPVVEAFEKSNSENPPGIKAPKYQDSFTWTFYTIVTSKGAVTIRWYGESNGYYSESVDFDRQRSIN
jgi:hypothetical protein